MATWVSRFSLGFILVVALGSCADQQPTLRGIADSVEEPSLGPVSVIRDPKNISLPLDKYELNLEDTVSVDRAVHQVVTTCMTKFGFDYNEPFNERDTSAEPNANLRRYGLLDEANAQQYGYHGGPNEPGEKKLLAQKQGDQPNLLDDPAARNVLGAKGGPSTYNGMEIPEGGCFGQARRTVAEGGPAFDPSLAEQLGGQAWFQSEEDSRVKAAYQSWSECTSGKGFDYRTSRDANNDARWSGPDATDAEIAVAVADVQCKKETNLVGIRMAVETAYQRVLIVDHAEELQQLMEGQQRELRNSAELLTPGQ